MKINGNSIDIEKVKSFTTLNGGLGIILNVLLAIGVFASMDERYGIMIGVVFIFLALWITSIKAMIQLYDVKFKDPKKFTEVRPAYVMNIINLILMSIGFTATTFWSSLMLDF
jgi:hypothetical protein